MFSLFQNEKDVVRLPRLENLYHESLYGLLCAGSYSECIAICDRLLICQTGPSSQVSSKEEFHRRFDNISKKSECDNLDVDEPLSVTLIGRTRKRHRSELSQTDIGDNSQFLEKTDEDESLNELKGDVVALLYKGDALVQLQKYKEAADCLHR